MVITTIPTIVGCWEDEYVSTCKVEQHLADGKRSTNVNSFQGSISPELEGEVGLE